MGVAQTGWLVSGARKKGAAANDLSPVEHQMSSSPAERYRVLLMLEDGQVSPEAINAKQISDAKMSRVQILRCRVRYFTEGIALGDKSFVKSMMSMRRGDQGG